jgi:hypothetical protein
MINATRPDRRPPTAAQRIRWKLTFRSAMGAFPMLTPLWCGHAPIFPLLSVGQFRKGVRTSRRFLIMATPLHALPAHESPPSTLPFSAPSDEELGQALSLITSSHLFIRGPSPLRSRPGSSPAASFPRALPRQGVSFSAAADATPL